MTGIGSNDDPAADLIAFSDLDGTLLDHRTYGHGPAEPTLDRLRRHHVPLVLASSKTAAEMVPLRAELGFGHIPMICENGAGFVPGGQHGGHDVSAYQDLRQILSQIPGDLRASFEGFADMSAARLIQVTGLAPEAAARAAKRQFSEPGIWTGSDAALADFLAALSDHGVAARRGGRFLTLSFGATKADQMDRISTDLQRGTIIALGDAPNDIEMLANARYAIILPNEHGKPIPAPDHGGTEYIRSMLPGPDGWHDCLGRLLTRLGVPQ